MLIIDASVAIALVIPEHGSAAARRAVESADRLAAPDLIWSECVNVLWLKSRRNEITAREAERALDALLNLGVAVTSASALAKDTLRLARDLQHAAYDCTYLAAAIANQTVIVTLDRKFAAAAQAAGYGDRVRLLTA